MSELARKAFGGRSSATAVVFALSFLAAAGPANQCHADTSPVSQSHEHGPLMLHVQVDRTAAQVADPIHLTLTVTAPAGVAVVWPQVGSSLGDLKIARVDEVNDVPDGGRRMWRRTYALESYSPGPRSIPPIDVAYRDRRAGEAVDAAVRSQPVVIEIESVLAADANPAEFRDVKGVVTLAENSKAMQIAAAVSAAVVLLVAAAVILHQRRRKPQTPLAWALEQLARLENEQFAEGGEMERLYARLTDVVREFIERRFAIDAPKLTTDEFLRSLSERPVFDDSSRRLLAEFLTTADMVKFARLAPTREQAREAFSAARTFVVNSARDREPMQENSTALAGTTAGELPAQTAGRASA